MSTKTVSLYDQVMKAAAEQERISERIVRLNDQDRFDEAQALHSKLRAAKRDFSTANDLYLSQQAATEGQHAARRSIGRMDADAVRRGRATPEYLAEWVAALRTGVTPATISQGMHNPSRFRRLINALTESGGSPAGEDGGFLAPLDFDNQVHELMREYVDLGEHVNRQEVTSLAGWRVVEQAAAAQPLTQDSAELEVRTTEGEGPKFTKIEFSLDEYKDFLPVSNALMQDNSSNLLAFLARWFSKKLVLTNNSLILALINAITPTAVTDYKTTLSAIKTMLNKTLDPVFSATASIFTNQSGFDMLDQLDDGTGRPLLQPDPTSPTAFQVKGRPVVQLTDTHWANLDTPARARIAIGDGFEFCMLFQRAGFEFASTSIGGDAWRSNSTEVRGIARLDCKQVDSGAMGLLSVTLPS